METQTEPQLESQLLELVATDRIYIPISSMDGKLKRTRAKLARGIVLPGNAYDGERVYARTCTEDVMKARGMRDAIDVFESQYPRHGAILRGLIAEQRQERESHIYFGMKEGCKMTADDYLGVMQNLGFTEKAAREMYPEIMNASRSISRKRDEERSIMLESTL